MDTSELKKFAAQARTDLIAQVGSRLDYVLGSDAVELRDRANDIEKIKLEISKTSREALIERVAYLWFNRMTALRYMDANRYTDIGIVSPAPNQTQPEILAEAKTGSVDSEFASDSNIAEILSLLSGQTNETDPEGVAYRKLFLGACNYYGQTMSFMFESIADWTELLLPEDLLSDHSILSQMRDVMTEDVCQDVEVIGWLYQFYIAEKKDEVFARPKGTKITPENIPAATQLFTPHWIVRYLLENSLGRLWLLNNPNSGLIDHMEYYIKPEEPEGDFLKITSPEEIKICDPACGSGHMLTYAFDLLYAIYEERGYDPSDIPGHILTNNLFGIEIDERAGALSAFALTMKARARQRRALSEGLKPNICILENVTFKDGELGEYIDEVGHDLFTTELSATLAQFENAKNFGSLIVPKLTDASEAVRVIGSKNFDDQLFLRDVHQRVQKVIDMVEYLSPKYHVVVANPPYLGRKGMNGVLKTWIEKSFPLSSRDLYSSFIERTFGLAVQSGSIAIIAMDAWVTSGLHEFRKKILSEGPITSALHLGTRAFDSISGEVVSTFAFVRSKTLLSDDHVPIILDLREGKSEQEKLSLFKIRDSYHSTIKQKEFFDLQDAPMAYWLPLKFVQVLKANLTLRDVARPRSGLTTSNNDFYLRYWWEVSHFNKKISSIDYPFETFDKWVPINGGSNFRRWYGSNKQVLLWEQSGTSLVNNPAATMANPKFQFRAGVTWSKISGSNLSVRKASSGFMFTAVGLKAFPEEKYMNHVCGMLNSKLVEYMVPIFSSNLTILSGDIAKYPFITKGITVDEIVDELVKLSAIDWDSYEHSWDFMKHPLLELVNKNQTLASRYVSLRSHWRDIADKVQKLESINNSIFINAYGLEEELSPEVPMSEVTLTSNPVYRYGEKNTDRGLENKLCADTMREFLHYSVGCMFGRYSLDKPGLILVNEGETLEDFLTRVPNPTFEPDDDNIIPVLNGHWFSDDIVERFKVFLRNTFGSENYAKNLTYIESAIGRKIRDWFFKDFYGYHVQRFKKRPIYWMVSSPKGSFNVLFYMHRYRPELFSQVLEDYLRPFLSKLEGHLGDLNRTMNDSNASARDIKTATKEIDDIQAIQRELHDWERDVLYPLAGKRLPMDLDDGVKVNYPRFAPALKKIPGL